MIVHLGKSTRPLPCGPGQSVFNAASCDSASILSLLCLHLGIAVPEGDRVLEMNALLAEAVYADDFFSRSYKVDPLGVSRRLLDLIDEITVGAAVDFSWAVLSGEPRLAQIARIASQLEQRGITMSPAVKLRRIISVLGDSATSVPFTRVILSESRPTWPRLWRDLFSALEATGVLIDERETIKPVAGITDLNRVAKKILPKETADKVAFADDHSIIRINGASVGEVSDAVAGFIQSELNENKTIAVVRSGEPDALDAAFTRQNLPALGYGRSDRGFAPVEILPLMLDLISGPADPATFLGFLSAEPNPLPSGLRQSLIRELRENSAVNPEISCAKVDSYVSKISDPKIAERAAMWKDWLSVDSHRTADGISGKGIDLTLQRIESWAESSIGWPGTDESVVRGFSTLISNIRSLRDAIAVGAEQHITRSELQKITTQILTPPRLITQREQSSVLMVDDASAIHSAVDTVIWWMAHDGILPHTRGTLWTMTERAVLERSGVELQPPQLAFEESYAAATRLLAAATHRLVLVTVDRIGDDHMAVHPLWHEIEESFTDSSRPKAVGVHGVWNLLVSAGRKDLANVDLVPKIPFSPTWDIPHAPYAARNYESPSSLEKMLGCPLAWTLQYRAGLDDKSPHGLMDGFLLLGNLAHACFEKFFKSGSSVLPTDQATTAATQIFEHCLRSRAGALLVPGRDHERLDAQSKIVSGMLDLTALMAAGEWEFLAAEEFFQTEKTEGLAQSMQGRLDLLFQRKYKPSEKLIVDAKYSGKTGRIDQLKQGSAIQLATYSRILRAGEAWPKTAYYIVSSRELLTVHSDVAPNLLRIKGEDEPDVWSRVEDATNETTGRLAQGLVDVGIEDEKAKVLAESGRVAPAPCKYCNYRLFCGTVRRSA